MRAHTHTRARVYPYRCKFYKTIPPTSPQLSPSAHLAPLTPALKALYLSTMTITTVGYGDIAATNITETVLLIFLMSVGAAVWALVLGNAGKRGGVWCVVCGRRVGLATFVYV